MVKQKEYFYYYMACYSTFLFHRSKKYSMELTIYESYNLSFWNNSILESIVLYMINSKQYFQIIQYNGYLQ